MRPVLVLLGLFALVGCREAFDSVDTGTMSASSESTGASGEGSSTDGSSTDSTTGSSSEGSSTETDSTGEETGDGDGDATGDGDGDGDGETTGDGDGDESETTEGGPDLQECLTVGFSFPEGPPVAGQLLRLGFTSQVGHAGVAFQVEAFAQDEVDLVNPEPPFTWAADIPGAEVPPGPATIRFIEGYGFDDNVVAQCVANY